MSKKVREQMVNQMKTKGCLEFPFNFLGDIVEKGTAEGAEITRLAADSGIRFCTLKQSGSKKLFKACDKELKWENLGKAHTTYKYFEEKVWNNDGDCIGEGIFICAVDKVNLADSCLLDKGLTGSIGDACECATTI